MIHASLATKYVFTAAMIAFINHYAPRLHLPLDVPIKQSDIKHLYPPVASVLKGKEDYGDRMVIKNYSISIGDGCLDLVKVEDDGMQSFGIPMEHLRESSGSLMERASRMKYTVSTNDFYAIGTNYLVAMEIDVKNLEKSHPPNWVKHLIFHSDRGLVPSPLLSVHWEQTHFVSDDPGAVSLQISAVSGELLEFVVGTKSGCKGLPLINNLEKLLAITDEEFLKMSATERTNLLYRFANNYLFPPPATTNQVLMRQATNLPAKNSHATHATSP